MEHNISETREQLARNVEKLNQRNAEEVAHLSL